MVHVFVAKVNNLPDPMENLKIMKDLPEERIEKIQRIRTVDGRKRSLGAGLLLEYAKKQYQDVENIHFNLSHSGEMAICAASYKAVGCDIERIKEAPLKVAERFFCNEEVQYLNSVEEGMKTEAFFRLWTIKESYIKMTGKGLGQGLGTFRVLLNEPVKIIMKNRELEVFIKEYQVPGYKLSVCSEDEDFREELEYIEI